MRILKWRPPPTPCGLPVEDVFIRSAFGEDIPGDVAADPEWQRLAKTDPARFIERMAAMRGDSAPSDEQSIVAAAPSMSVDLLLTLRAVELRSGTPRNAVLEAIHKALGGEQ